MSEPPDTPDPDAAKRAAYKAYCDARLGVTNAQNRFVKAFDAYMKLADLGNHVPPAPRPDGTIVGRRGAWGKPKPLPWWHWINVLQFLGLALLGFLALYGLWSLLT